MKNMIGNRVVKVGFLIIENKTNMRESKRRLYRKHRQKRLGENFFQLKPGVYFIPIEEQEGKLEAWRKLANIFEFLDDHGVDALYFKALIIPQNWIEELWSAFQ